MRAGHREYGPPLFGAGVIEKGRIAPALELQKDPGTLMFTLLMFDMLFDMLNYETQSIFHPFPPILCSAVL